jgi:hypothetical protein
MRLVKQAVFVSRCMLFLNKRSCFLLMIFWSRKSDAPLGQTVWYSGAASLGRLPHKYIFDRILESFYFALEGGLSLALYQIKS